MTFNPFDDGSARIKLKLVAIYAVLIIANVGAWAWALIAFHNNAVLLGTALLAYTFGLRHAFDADHIAAIDNVVRKLVQDGKTPCSVGFFFSLGHSSIVLLATIAIVALQSAMRDRFEPLHALGGVIGTTVSTLFLLTIGLANFFVMRSTWAAFLRSRRGEKVGQADLDSMLGGGPFSRILRPVMRLVSSSWQMYAVGFLFGLGFDTATEIGVLGISATQSAQGISPWTVLVFPALFTAGMSLMDTTDSVLMTRAYGWALLHPVRKLWYNLTITAASVAVALFVGGMEALGLIRDKMGFEGRFWQGIEHVNDNLVTFGYLIVGVFLASWILSVLLYRMKGLHQLDLERAPTVS